MNWLQHSIECIELIGVRCRLISKGYSANGWVMPDGTGVIHESGVTVDCPAESIETDNPEALRLARAGSANRHFKRYDQGYTIIEAGDWDSSGDKWVRQYRAGIEGNRGSLAVHVQFKPGCAELLRFYTEYVSDPQPESTIDDQVRQGQVGDALHSGEVVRSASGRLCSPFPKIDFGSDRKSVNTLKRTAQWLIQNALDEAQARGDSFNELQFRASLSNPQQADKDCAEQYLFGEQPTVIPSPLSMLIVPA
ncbi:MULTISPECIES: hypothetical protein [Pseudomonadaceae]|uniref:hypothetical protein n=1 Tax=Pseudomonadaceae TaxID=135621 RepID=UPI0015E4141D|nr:MULTISPECIES: hypothetical protein [Pseudomonadaceae]MBA1280468.1 hypothetical protein [Stutzerimonas stutzeri]MBH8610682.1 hypothetical protein [Pseudomonas mohnii]